ncbi:hypothetical protein [Bosea sp. (in: a-proteobacteria)]|uniref:hypothetical protein n=1 Tax=Bosea sp. (in: a-proteobacteria) TaxID=1871050 RepID=UPI0025B97D06|nr:hypothetical protein [Bosea sp. (in: a-proteobacteria)]MBR3190445.1 hypothetical protein [Bosea sp. (in: a-proteobacteria)]
MSKYQVELTSDEQALLEKIDLRSNHRNHDEGRAAYLSNQQPILALLKALSERSAIPAQRVSYWRDPAYNNGRMKGSNESMFHRNGNSAAETYTHPHFLPYLRYFLFGADLPDAVIAAFEEHVGNPEWVTSGDIAPMCKYARDLMRRYGLERTDAAEEFFKLCLDMGLGLSTAQFVRRAVMQVR